MGPMLHACWGFCRVLDSGIRVIAGWKREYTIDGNARRTNNNIVGVEVDGKLNFK